MFVLYIDPLLDFEQSVLYSRIVELLMAKTAVRKYRGQIPGAFHKPVVFASRTVSHFEVFLRAKEKLLAV